MVRCAHMDNYSVHSTLTQHRDGATAAASLPAQPYCPRRAPGTSRPDAQSTEPRTFSEIQNSSSSDDLAAPAHPPSCAARTSLTGIVLLRSRLLSFFFFLPVSELVLEYNMWIVTFTRETSRMFIDINKKNLIPTKAH